MARPIKFRDGKWRGRPIDALGVRQSGVFDTHEECASFIKQVEAAADACRRGVRVAIPAGKTLNDMFDYWLAQRAPRKRSEDDDKSIIRKHLRPSFGTLRLPELNAAHTDEFTRARAHLGEHTIGNHLTLLIAVLHAAVDIGWLEQVPRIKKPKIKVFSKSFRYLRNDDEINRFLAAALAEGEYVHALYAVAVHTGMREGEVAGLWWPNIDLARRLITIERSFDGPTKSDEPRHVPILDPLLPILSAWHERHPGDRVFTNAWGNPIQPSSRVFQEVLHRVLAAAGFPKRETAKGPRPWITFHDLRHTFASRWMMRGGDIFKLQKILGHQTVQMTMRYAHLAPDAFAADWARFGPAVTTTNPIPATTP